MTPPEDDHAALPAEGTTAGSSREAETVSRVGRPPRMPLRTFAGHTFFRPRAVLHRRRVTQFFASSAALLSQGFQATPLLRARPCLDNLRVQLTPHVPGRIAYNLLSPLQGYRSDLLHYLIPGIRVGQGCRYADTISAALPRRGRLESAYFSPNIRKSSLSISSLNSL